MLLDPVVSASMVLYHSGPQSREAVKCIKKSIEKVDLYVVDNSPAEVEGKTISKVYKDDPYVTLIQAKRNLGFGRAHNLVLPRLKSRYHIFINPDVTFDPELIGSMVQFLKDHPDVAIVTPRILNRDGSEQFVPRRQPTIRYILGGRLGKRFKRCQAWRREYTMEDSPVTEPTEVETASGCFMMIRTNALRRLGGFDPHFFLYMEDCDLSRRAIGQGDRIVYHPDMVVRHAWTRASMHSLKGLRRHLTSAFKYFMKWGWEW